MEDVDTKKIKFGIDWDFFDKPRWQLDAEARVSNSNAMLAVHQQYGENLVKQATAFLESRNEPVTAANIDAVIKAAKSAREKS